LEESVRIGLIARFFNLRNGGIGRFSIEILEGLKKKGYEIVPVSTNRKSSVGHVIYSSIELAFKLPKDCDVYHCLTPLEAIYAPKTLSVVTYHDLIPWLHLKATDTHYAQGWMKAIRDLGSKYYFKTVAGIASKCCLIACHSEYTRKELIEHLEIDESRISMIRYGISRNLEPKPKRDSVFRVGTLSYLDPRKRIDLLIQAFLAANVDGELVIGGAGTDYARLKRLARQDRRIKFLGFIPEERLADFYNSLDLFVFPTKIEGYGLPMVEAFACKKPVILLRDAIVTDEIKSRCTLVDNLTDFLRNPESAQDIEANYSFAKTHNWDTCVEEYLKLYQRVLEGK
jgi:glycosyltransferase involved in cell wall biosynthesis